MHNRLVRFHARLHVWNYISAEAFVSVLLVMLLLVTPAAAAAMRMQDRSLYMNSSVPGETTSYTVSFRYMSPEVVGSVNMLFCIDPIPYHPCVTPPGLDVSNAQLTDQVGQTGYSISAQSQNHIVLSRVPSMTAPSVTPSSYTFDNIINPTDTSQSFSIRLRTHTSADASGAQIDFGSVKGQVTDGVTLETQVPPMLIFCVAEEVEENCSRTSDNNFTDMGQLSHQSTLTARSQMSVGTNASGGFAITANGTPMSAGVNVIDSPDTPTESIRGTNQFGINLVANSSPNVGNDPEGIWANAITAPDYSVPNHYKYVPGDVVAYSPSVTLMKKYTVSYITNSREDLRAGVYSTTITYIASGRF